MTDEEILESALFSTGFGNFNVLVLTLAVPGSMAIVYALTTISFIIPRAECDFKLTLHDIAALNSMPYMGMLGFSILWAVLSDNFGRRKMGIITYFFDGIVVLMCSLGQNKYYLMFFKFLNGATIGGAFMVLLTYVFEMHTGLMRTRTMIFIGTTLTLTSMILPTQALAIVPLEWVLVIDDFYFRPWNLFILINSLPSFFTAIGFIFLPETPKFSMAHGDYDGALRTLKKMFIINTRRSGAEFPAKTLGTHDAPRIQYTRMQAFKIGWLNFKSIFQSQFIILIANIFIIEFFVVTCQNTYRLWLPQFFNAVHNAKEVKGNTICKIVRGMQFNTIEKVEGHCKDKMSLDFYVNNLFVGFASIIEYMCAALVLKFLGSKVVLCTTLGLAALISIAIPFANTENQVTAVFALFVASETIASTYIFNVCLHLFPTKMRNTVLGMGFTFSRIGCFLANLTFAGFLNYNCMGFCIFITSVNIVAFILSLFLPNPQKPY